MIEKALLGLDVDYTNDLVSQYTAATNSGFAFITVDLFHPKLSSSDDDSQTLPLTRSDLVFQKNDQSIVRCLVGRISSHIDVDSELAVVRVRSEAQLKKELSWASHLGLPAVMLYLTRPNNANLSRLISDFIAAEYLPIKIWVGLPMCIEEHTVDSTVDSSGDASEKESFNTISSSSKDCDPWHWWHMFSTLASDVSESLGLVLQLPCNLPDEDVIARWLSEPVVCLILRTEIFLTNTKGYPILPKSHQSVLQRFFRLNVQILLSGACRHDHGFVSYQKYITWLWKNREEPDVYDQQSKGLEDQLQEPLQPLRDNLSSTTYAVFETDLYKYEAYEKAIGEALAYRTGRAYNPAGSKSPSATPINGLSTVTSHDEPKPAPFVAPPLQVVAVLGAGRGPLVNATLCASQTVGVPVRVYVIEKNPNALYTLQDRMTHEWQGLDVHLISSDMRCLSLPEKADIFVSELLGSFGDNELSPECLDGAQPCLKDDGISIPCSYTSYIAPLQSLPFYSESKRSRDPTACPRNTTPTESPFVVRLLNCQILADPVPVFTFQHPKPDPTESNARSISCTFKIGHDAVVHGLAGYFEAKLFGDVMLSTHPKRHSPRMVSWFPMAFPLDRPVTVRAGQPIRLHMWRVVDARHVWYEWALSEPYPVRIHNVGGHAYKMAL